MQTSASHGTSQERFRHIPFAAGLSVQEYLPAEAGLESAAKMGFSHWYIDFSSDANRPGQWGGSRSRNLLGRCEAAKVRPILHGNGQAALGHEIVEVRTASAAYVKQEIRLAAEIGAPLILHGGPYYATRQYHSTLNQAFSRFLDELAEMANFASNCGVEVWIENLPRYARPPFGTLCSSVEEMARVVQIAGVKAVVDLGHANIDGGDPTEMLSVLTDRVACISVSDNDGRSDAHLPPGSGTIDFASLLRLLAECEWRGVVNIELHHGDVGDAVSFLSRIGESRC